MKRLLLCMTSALAVLVVPAAATETQGWYLGIGAGANWMDGTAKFVGIPDTGLNYQPNARFSADVGYKWENWRAEIEPNWVTNDAGLVGFKGGSTTGAVMGNLLYDFDLGNRWMLTGGAGIGAARVSHDVRNLVTGDLFLGGRDTGFAWQAIAGISYGLTDHVEVGVEYRFMDTGDTGAVSQYAPVKFDNGQNQLVMASVRWFPFAEEAVAPPAPPPPSPPLPSPPPPPPPPPLPVKTFIVFFDFDKSDVTEAARQTVAEAANVVQQNGFAKVIITGHTDTMGSDRYNQRLSERRAAAIKAVMISMGVPDNEIATAGKSFNDPMVSTGRNVREPKNRRAVIDLNQ